MTVFITVADLQVFAPDINTTKAQGMIDDATAMVTLIAPCINANGFANLAAVKAILRQAILRWNDAGTGALQSQAVGPFNQTIDTRPDRKAMFWPSEIEQLQSLCATGSTYTLDMTGPDVASTVTTDVLNYSGWGYWP